jgi:hypothetical protein
VSRPLVILPSGSPHGIHTPGAADPLIAALARFVEALHRRYPDGPEQLRQERLDGSAKVSAMVRFEKDPAA